jgi:hypothetical protein
MRRLSRLFAWGLLVSVLPWFGVQAATPDGCNASYTLNPLDESVVTLLGDAVVPSKQSIFVDPRLQQLQALDFPSKVTAWADRPAPPDMTSRRAALLASSAGGKGAPAGTLQPYLQRPIPAKDFADLEKWFAKEAPKKVQGLCVDPANAGYVLAVGVITEGSQAGPDNSMARSQYDQSITRQADRSVGPNAATVTPGGGDRPSDELSALASGGPSLPGTHTCVYLFVRGRGHRTITIAMVATICRSRRSPPC